MSIFFLFKAHNSTSRLYESYCKFLVSYDTLNREEKQKLEHQVTTERTHKRAPYIPECVMKSKLKQLDEFFKYAKFSEAAWFDEDPTYQQVEVGNALMGSSGMNYSLFRPTMWSTNTSSLNDMQLGGMNWHYQSSGPMYTPMFPSWQM